MTKSNLHRLCQRFERATVKVMHAESCFKRLRQGGAFVTEANSWTGYRAAILAFNRASDIYRDTLFDMVRHGKPSERARAAAILEADGIAVPI